MGKSAQLGLYTILLLPIVWCMAYTQEVGGGGRILPNSRGIVLHQGGAMQVIAGNARMVDSCTKASK